jgi:hypothetical protein
MQRRIIKEMTVSEISTVDRPAQKGAVAVILKSEGAAIRKNAGEVAAGMAKPLFKATDYQSAILDRAAELGKEQGITPEQALMRNIGHDQVLGELSRAERAAEDAVREAKSAKLAGQLQR